MDIAENIGEKDIEIEILPSSHILVIVFLWLRIVSLDLLDLCELCGLRKGEDLVIFSFV